MKTHPHHRSCRHITAVLASSIAALLGSPSAFAAPITWGNTGTDFNAGASWVGVVAPGSGDQPTFTGPAVTNADLSAGLSVQDLVYSSATSSGYLLSSANGSVLTLTNPSGTSIAASNTSGTNTISAALILAPTSTIDRGFSQAAGGTLNLTGGISSTNATSGDTNFGGGGTINLSGTNTFNSIGTVGSAFINIGTTAGTTTTLGITGGTTTMDIGSDAIWIGGGSSTANGTVTVSGGTLNMNGSGSSNFSADFGRPTNTGILNVSGGTVNIGSSIGLIFGFGASSAIGTLNVNSGTITVNKGTIGTTTSTEDTRYILLGQDRGNGTINLGYGAGSTGVLATDRIIAADGSSGAGGATTAAFVFNGGTLKALGANSDWLQAGASSTSNTNAAALTSVTTTAVSTIDANSFAVGINSAISGAGGFTITDSSGTGTGVVTLGGANTYTGATTVSAGTLKAGVASVANVSGAFGNNSAVSMANVAGATLDITGFNTQIGSLTGGGTTGGNVTLGAATLTVGGDNTSPAAYAGIISGTGGALTKIGTGTLTLGGANTYTGATTVSAGTLLVSGSISGSTTMVTGAGSTLGGTGTVGGVTVNSGAILEGGNGSAASGALSSGGNVSLLSGSDIELTLGPSATHSSLVRTGGTWSFDSDQAFAFNIAPGASGSTTYNDIISGLSGLESGLGNIANWTISTPGVTGTFFYDGAGNVDLTVVTIPEPGTAALLLAGLPLLGLRRRRR